MTVTAPAHQHAPRSLPLPFLLALPWALISSLLPVPRWTNRPTSIWSYQGVLLRFLARLLLRRLCLDKLSLGRPQFPEVSCPSLTHGVAPVFRLARLPRLIPTAEATALLVRRRPKLR